MSGIHFIDPNRPHEDHPELDDISVALVAPLPYFREGSLSEHLTMAIEHILFDLNVRGYVNLKSGMPFQCISYYADDPDVIAYCAVHDDAYLATIGVPFVRRLVKICDRIGSVLHSRDGCNSTQEAMVAPDEVLTGLMKDAVDVPERETQAIVGCWPAADTRAAQMALGGYALFYDLIRLIWMHEWAHALCGHVALASSELHIARLHEFSTERVGAHLVDKLGYPRDEVLQSLEIHADEFAVRYCLHQILWGYDPIGIMAGPMVNQNDRLMVFNTACAIFAVMWNLAEDRYSPHMSYYPPPVPLDSSEPDPMFMPYKTTHPPADLRYLRFRGFTEQLVSDYGRERGHPNYAFYVNAASNLFLTQSLGPMCKEFFSLRPVMPLVSKTPTMDRLWAYEAHLLRIEDEVEPFLVEMGFRPTFDPHIQIYPEN